MSRIRALPLAVWVGTGLVWGTTWGVIRLGLQDMPPFTFAALRTLLAAATLLVVAQLVDGRRRPTGPESWFWAVIGLFQIGAPYALIFWAEQSLSSGMTAILFATFPAFTAIAAHFLLRDESLSLGTVAGTLLALVAVGLLVTPSRGAVPAPGAVAAVLVASMAAALGVVLVRRHGRSTSTLWLTALQVSSAAVFLGVLALTLERGDQVAFTATAVVSIVYLALAVTVGCYLGLFWLLKRLDATFVSMGVIFETAVGVFFGSVVLSEPLGLRVFGGLALVGISVYLVTVGRRREREGAGAVVL
ncbi:MAG: DMT family transporter [Gemmatimonadetes bacterium]|nr:DMT family transporter [Gemmatimonadota bacterium]